MDKPTTEQVLQRIRERVPPHFRFVNQEGRPMPPFGWHFPWDGNPTHCAVCEKGPAELTGRDAGPCDFDWVAPPPKPLMVWLDEVASLPMPQETPETPRQGTDGDRARGG